MRSAIGVALILLTVFASAPQAENIIFPPNTAGVFDITKPPYNADRTGKTDVAAIITRALNDKVGGGATAGGWGSIIVYLPNGTYLVKSKVFWKLPPYALGPHLQGQSRKGTVIRLADSTYRSASQAGIVVQTGGDVAQNFNRGLFNVTVYTGKGNPGAVGVFWYGNNESLMSDVDIISGDGQGFAGLEVGTVEEGPCMARRVYVKGFRFGVLARSSLNTTTLSEISLEGQTQYGVHHTGNFPLYIDSLYSRNSVTAVYNGAQNAQLVLINANLLGGNGGPAIINETGGMLFARKIVAQGYERALASTSGTTPVPAGLSIDEYSSHGCISLFNAPSRSLNLPIKRPPEPEWEQDMNKWANVANYASLQAAIDDPAKTVVVLPMGREWPINGTVNVRGNIKMIIATGSQFTGGGALAITDGAAPVVKIMKIAGAMSVVQRSGRTVVLESTSLGLTEIRDEGSGDLFLTDIGWCPLRVTNPAAHVWARHFDAEFADNLTVSAGTVWIFGWKDEGYGISATQTGGVLEIIGYYNYVYGSSSTTSADQVPGPQFVLSGGSFSLASGVQGQKLGKCPQLVRQTYKGVTRELLATANPAGYPTSYDMPMFTAYDPVSVLPASAGAAANIEDAWFGISAGAGRTAVLRWSRPFETIAIVNSLGRTVRMVMSDGSAAGRTEIGFSGLPFGSYRVVAESAGRRVAECLTIVR